jgi:MFS family permease
LQNPAPDQAPRRGALSSLSALKHPNYRYLWLGNFISNSGDWVDQVALNWLVITTTGSPVALGLVNLARGASLFVLVLFGGVIADRFNRRKIMFVTQTFAMLLAIALWLLAATDHATIPAIMLLVVGRGIMLAINNPVRQALISELVPREDLASAVALNAITFNLSKVIGPLIAAGILVVSDVATCFLVNAISFTVVLAMLGMMTIPDRAKPARHEPLTRTLTSGFAYMGRNTTILLLVLTALVPAFFAQCYTQILTLFAYDVFHNDASGLGIMVAIAALGSAAGGVLAAYMQREQRSGAMMLTFMFLFGASLVGFSASPTLMIAMPLLFVAGAMHIAYNSSNTTILQLSVDDAFRGRVLATLMTTRGLISFGTFATATLAAFIGTRWAMGSMAAVVAVFAVYVRIAAPRLWTLRI